MKEYSNVEFEKLSYDFAPCCKMFGITKQLLPGLLVDSADYHPSKELFPSGVALGEIIPSRGDNLHYPPTSKAITVYYTIVSLPFLS